MNLKSIEVSVIYIYAFSAHYTRCVAIFSLPLTVCRDSLNKHLA